MSGYRARDVTKWRLEIQEDGSWDVYQGRKRIMRNADYVGAIRKVRSKTRDDEPIKVVSVEPDGYETDITRTVQRGR